MTAPFAPIVLDEIAPARAHERLKAKGGSRHGGREDRGAFQDALGRAMAPSGDGDGAAAAGASPKAAHPSCAHVGLASALLRLGGQPDMRGSSPADEARSQLEQARRPRTPGRGARANAEEAAENAKNAEHAETAETADRAAREALAAAVQHARQATSVPLAGVPAPAPSAPSRTDRAKGERDAAVDATARGKLHEQNAAARASAVKSALEAGEPLGLTAAASHKPLAAHAPGRQARERDGAGEKDRDAAKRETGAAASRPEAPLPPAPDAQVAALRPSPGASLASPPSSDSSATDGPRAALPPSPGLDVQGALLRNAAHLKIEAGAMGALELHLRVHEGALHLRVEGDAAPTVEARAGELSRALAGEGLKLAPIETAPRDAMSQDAGRRQGADGGGGRSFEERREAWNEAVESGGGAPPATSPRSPQPRPAHPGSSGVHVKA